ncbi:MAG TPA: polysaccharide biosynthesis/export family protein [Acidobacteriaceae bacterium]|jgi:polysaccharide export outer membrane protein
MAGLFEFALTPPQTLAQESLAPQAGAQETPITPAVNPPSAEPNPLQPLFPEPNVTTPQSARSLGRPSVPLGPAGSAGLGFRAIEPADIVEVQIFEAPEYSVRMPVSASGDIAIPYAGIFHIEGMTSIEAAKAIAHLFESRQILRDPRVIVTTEQFGYSVTLLGEVRSPGVYPLAGRQRLIDVLTEAGGVTNNAGHVIEVFAAGSMKNPRTLLWDPTLRENDNAEITLKAGETVLVSRCGVVYIGGNVNRAGAFPLCDTNHTTLSQVMALAQGTRPNSWAQRTILLRTSGSGTRVIQKVKLDDVLRGKKTDLIMQPDDIIFVPPSSLKYVGKVAISSAFGFATQASFFFIQ